jgi:hypothetical protein
MRKKLPKSGDTRYKIKFAWIPQTIGDHKIWLERYYVQQEYRRIWHDSPGKWEIIGKGLYENLPSRLNRLHNDINKS